jgi:hypothetical protein
MDTTYAPSLLANHGAGKGRGARLELLTPDAAPLHEHGGDHVDRPTVSPSLHGVHGSSSGVGPVHGAALPLAPSSVPAIVARSQTLLVDTLMHLRPRLRTGQLPSHRLPRVRHPVLAGMVDGDQSVHSPSMLPNSASTPSNSPSESSSPDSPTASPSLVPPPVVSGPVTRRQ